MGLGGISPFQLIIILLIVLLLFGGKRLRSLGSDLGSAIKGFRKSMDDSTQKDAMPENIDHQNGDQKQSQDQSQTESHNTKQK